MLLKPTELGSGSVVLDGVWCMFTMLRILAERVGSSQLGFWVLLRGSTKVFGRKTITPTENFLVEVLFRVCGANVGQVGV